ncbi:helix-turn-helix domain-containing protein [Kribbella monticola]|uniref:helix-turn-helix domain-containing protein n=1 Tax=Kribbella monticola TaxID=2185285 RepID=UPI000DD3F98B|nr:helix-turn-helix domain-containing protein [Kribbella monticola]
MLESLGIGPAEERLYADLLANPASTAEELAGRHPDLPDLLASLRAGRLIRDDDGLLSAVPPALALQTTLDAQRLELERAAARVRELDRLHRATPDPFRRAPVEVVPGEEAHERLGVLLAATQHELRAFDTPPYGKVLEPADAEPAVMSLQRGVRQRIVYDRAAVGEHELDTMLPGLAAGEEARVVGELPLRLSIFDDRAAALPLRVGLVQTEGLLLVWPSSLLDALIALFERVWDSALPLILDETTTAGGEADDDRTLIALLAAGMGDQAIARHLGISLRTVGRRVQRVQNDLNAATRFQAGVAVGLQLAEQGRIHGPKTV